MSYQSGGMSKAADFQQFYYDAWRTWGLGYSEMYRDLRIYAGDSWLQSEKHKLKKQNRMILELPKIRRVVNQYEGYQRENRVSIVSEATQSANDKTAEQLSACMLDAWNNGNGHIAESEAFGHMLKTGLGIIGIYMDYSNDPISGDIKFYWKPFNAVMLDPYFTKRDLSDCDKAATRDLISREQAKDLLPFVDPSVIDNIPTGIRDNKYQYLGLYRQYNSSYIAQNLLTYDQFWERTRRKTKFLLDIQTGEQLEVGKDFSEEEIQMMLESDENLRIRDGYQPTVNLTILLGDQEVYSGPDPTGLDDFPFLPVLGYFEPLIDSYDLKIQGVVRSARDAQRQYNRRHSQIIDIMESVINTGWITKNGAVLDPKMLFQSGQSKNVVVDEGFDVNTDIKQISPPNIPSGYLQYQDIMDKNIFEIPGGSEEVLGLSSTGDERVSGKLAEVRASNGMKTLRSVYDNFEQTLMWLGGKVQKCIQLQYSPGKVRLITGEEPTDEFYYKYFGRYNSVVSQTILTQTQREAFYYHLLQLRQLGVNISDEELMEEAPVALRTSLKESVAKRNQAAQEAQEIQMQQQRMLLELQSSQVNENTALAQERRARVLADIGLAKERHSETAQNYSKALLDNAKTIAEIEDMGNKRLVELLKISTDLRAKSTIEEERVVQQGMNKLEALK